VSTLFRGRAAKYLPPTSESHGGAPWISRRAGAAACLAVVLALIAAAIAAVGPARKDRATYAWPPAALPDVRPSAGWYAPLPLLNRVPASLEMRLPCGLSPALRPGGTAVVLATARRPQTPALRIATSGNELRISVSGRELAHLPWPQACPQVIRVMNGDLFVRGAPIRLGLTTLGGMPIVTGLFTTLDLGRGRPPEVLIRTRPFRTTFTALQAGAAGCAVVLLIAAFIVAGGIRRIGKARIPMGRVWAARDPTDVVVVATVLVWWVVAPVFTDDGWIWAENRTIGSFHGVGVLYDVWGLISPVGYWLEWLTHWVVGTTSDLIVMRIPSLIVVLAAWPLCRFALHLAVGAPPSRVARWTLAGAFLVGAFAWEMTVRPEPFISLLVLGVLCAVLSFVRSPKTIALVVAALLIVFAFTAHPAGIVAAASVLAAAPALVRWLRTAPAAVVALVTVALGAAALGLVIFVLDADLHTRLASAGVFQGADRHREPPWHEYLRYSLFDQYGGGDVGRRLSLALLLLGALAWPLRPRHVGERLLVEPVRAVAIGLVLLAFVSSKWPWHFGTLAPIGAVAIASEVARLEVAPVARARIALATAAIVGAVVWALRAPDGWSPLDLQRLEWGDAFNARVLAVIFVLGAASAVIAIRRSPTHLPAWRSLPGGILTGACLVVVTLTVALLSIDAAKSSWSPARQNLEALTGRTRCGLADHLTGDRQIANRLASSARTLLAPAIAPYLPCATPALVDGALLEIPSFFAYQDDPWPVTGSAAPFAAIADLYKLEPVARGPHGVQIDAIDRRIPGFRRLDVTGSDPRLPAPP
jgi:hypothetical protein